MAEYPFVIGSIVEGCVDVVIGSRFQRRSPRLVVNFWHRVGHFLLMSLSNLSTDLNLADMETCYEAIRSKVIQRICIQEYRLGFDPEITAKIATFVMLGSPSAGAPTI